MSTCNLFYRPSMPKPNYWGCGLKAGKSSLTKPQLMQGPLTVSQSPAYLHLFRRKEPASQGSPGTVGAQAGSDPVEVPRASEGRAGGR
jgi:hypothetical protein